MNTKHKRAVVALVVAIATLATMGFRAPHDDSQRVSILPAETCNVLGSYTAIELLSVLDEPCFAGLVDEVERELDLGLGGATSAEILVNSVLERSHSTDWQVDLLELSETEAEAARVSTDLSANGIGARASLVTISDLAGFTSDLAESGIGLRVHLVTEADLAANEFDLSIDYHNPSSPWAEPLDVGGVMISSGSGVWSVGFVDYHNPSSPWAESLEVGGAGSGVEYEGFIDYHNPGAPDW